MRILRLFAVLLSASVAWGGLAVGGPTAANALCSDPCGGGGGFDPAVHAYVDLTVQGIGATSSVGSLTGGKLASTCTSSCTDSLSATASTEPDPTYTVTPASGWTVDHWTGCASGGGTSTTCTVVASWTESSTKTTDNTVAVAVYLRDTTAPTASITSGPSEGSYTWQSKPQFGFNFDGTGSVASSSCAIDSASFLACSSPWTTPTLADGPRTFTLRVTDAGGNVVTVSRHFTVDTHAPTVAIQSGPAGGSYVNSTSALFTFSTSDSNWVEDDCADQASAYVTSAPSRECGWVDDQFRLHGMSDSLSGLPQGIHSWRVTAYDKAGLATSISRTWYVDSLPPTASITGGPDEGVTTGNTAPTFDFSVDGTGSTATTTCQLDGPVSFAAEACTSATSEALSGLTDGAYALTLHLTDQATNTADVVRHFTVDTTVPSLSIDSGPVAGGYLATGSATFGFTAGSGTTVSCKLETDSAFRPCTNSSSDSLSGLADGAHLWTVKATNAASVSTTLSRQFTVDTQPPTAAFNAGPADQSSTNDASPVFGWTADGTGSPVTVTCSLDGNPLACTSPTTADLSSLSEATHTFSVHVVDASGHAVDISRTFTVDVTPPNVLVATGPADGAVVATKAISYFFSAGSGTDFMCSFDGTALGSCSGTGSDSHSGLADGSHSWQLQATDAAGNVTTVTRSFTVDTAAPTAEFTSGAPDQGFTNDPSSEFDFAVDGTGSTPSVTCAVDNAAAGACATGTSYVTPVLADGMHTVHVVVTDAAGNTATISRTFTVDTSAPAVTVVSGPAQGGSTNQSTVTFGFSADNGTSLGCAIDGGSYGLCTGTGLDTVSGLAGGTHTWQLRATDPAGNHTVVSRTFTVDVTGPSIASTTSWPRFSLGRSLTFAWTPADTGSGIASSDVQVQHATASGSFGAWSAPSGWTATTARKVSMSMTRGYTYCLRVRTRDNAGNVSGWSSSRCTTAPLDDTQLKHSAHWSKARSRAFYYGSLSRTTTRGATLTTGTIRAKHVSVLVTTCRGCGTIGVYRGRTLLRKVNLAATRTHNRVLVTVWSGSAVKSGTITIKVLSSGRTVQVDGLAVTRL